jgi:hypothetical protein
LQEHTAKKSEVDDEAGAAENGVRQEEADE